MNKSCFGYLINGKVYCSPCGRAVLDAPRSVVSSLEELHSSAKGRKCTACRTSLGETDQ